MAHPLSLLGIVHTALSVPPVVAGLYGFYKYRHINAKTRSGKIYLAFLTLSVGTSFGLSSVTGINPGHVLGVLALVAAFAGATVSTTALFGRYTAQVSALGLSTSFFLLLVPGLNETLTRLPPSHPLGTNIDSPIVRYALLAWVVIFLLGTAFQMALIRRQQKSWIKAVDDRA